MKTRWMPAAFALAGLIALTGLTGSAKAGLTVNGDTSKTYYWLDPSGPDGIRSQAQFDLREHVSENTAYHQAYSTEKDNSPLGAMLWKWDVSNFLGGVEDPVEVGSEFAYRGTGDQYEVTIDFSGSGFIIDTSGPAWLVVKDGDAGFIVFDLSTNSLADVDKFSDNRQHRFTVNGNPVEQIAENFLVNWDGFSSLKVTNDAFGNNGISHVELWGDPFDGPSGTPPIFIPEPATSIVWLISACLCGLFIHRRVRRLRVA